MRSPSVRAPTAYFDALYMVDHGKHHLAPDRPDVYDHAAVARAHVRHHQLRHVEQREEIQLHQAARLFHRHVPGRQVGAHAGIVDEDVDGAEPFQGARDNLAAGIAAGEIARRHERRRPRPFRPSSERAVSDSFAPARANSAAQAAPIPSDAPVMRTTLPSIRIGTT